MKGLLCRLAEYHLALCEDEIEKLPRWVSRHLGTCARCQAAWQAYRRTREVMHQYAGLLPESPPAGWRPLRLSQDAKRRVFSAQIVQASVAAIVVAVVGFALWQRASTPVEVAPPQMAHRVTPLAVEPDKHPPSPTAKVKGTKPSPPERTTPSIQTPPVRQPRVKPAGPIAQPPKRILVASRPSPPVEPTQDIQLISVEESPSESPVPVQPVVVEAQPITSTPVPHAYVMEAAYPATTGTVE